MNRYNETSKFWNERFGRGLEKERYSNADSALAMPELEEGLNWLGRQAGARIDFGCGSGGVILRALKLGCTKAVGIDISSNAVYTFGI